MSEKAQKIKDAIAVVAKYFPKVGEMILKGHYVVSSKRGTDIEETERIVRLYSLLKNNEPLAGRKLQVLAFYLRNTYTRDFKMELREQYNITEVNMNTLNHNLRKAGYLVVDDYNETKNRVSKDLLDFKEKIIDKGYSKILIDFT